jgi:glutamate racemase
MTDTFIEIQTELQNLLNKIRELSNEFKKVNTLNDYNSTIRDSLILCYTHYYNITENILERIKTLESLIYSCKHYCDVIENVLKKVNDFKIISQLSNVEEVTPIKNDFYSD